MKNCARGRDESSIACSKCLPGLIGTPAGPCRVCSPSNIPDFCLAALSRLAPLIIAVSGAHITVEFFKRLNQPHDSRGAADAMMKLGDGDEWFRV